MSGAPSPKDALASLPELDLLRRPYVEAAYATGSVLAGIGTSASDVDVIVLVDQDSDKASSREDKALRRHGNVRYDFEVFSRAEYEAMLDQVLGFRTVWETGQLYHVDRALRMVTQVLAGTRVMKSSRFLEESFGRIAASRREIIRVSVAHAANFGNNAHEDLMGFLRDGDEVGALRRSHVHLEFALDAWCTARGAAYPDVKHKWIWRRLDRVLDGTEMAAVRELFVPELARVGIADVAVHRLDASQALLAQAQLAAWAEDPRSFTIPVLPRRAHGEDGQVWRDPGGMTIRTPDAWGLGVDFEYVDTPLTGAIAWAYAGGRSVPELASVVQEKARFAFHLGVGDAAARSAVERLLSNGILHAGSAPPSASRRRAT